MTSIVNKLTSMNMVLDNDLQALLLLGSLMRSWKTLVVSISNLAPDGMLTMSYVTNSLLNEEIRRMTSSVSSSQVLASVKKEVEIFTVQSTCPGKVQA